MRKVGSVGEETEKLVRKAAIELIAKHGFEAMTLRQLAQVVQLQQGSLYNHIKNKQDLLFDLLRRVMQDLLAAFDERVRPVVNSAEALDAFVTLHIEFHTARKNEVFLATTELRSLEPDNYRKIVKLRNMYEKGLVDLLKRGVDQGIFDLADVKLTAYALIAMLTGVSTWYRPSGKLSHAELLRIHMLLARRITLAKQSTSRRQPAFHRPLSAVGHF